MYTQGEFIKKWHPKKSAIFPEKETKKYQKLVSYLIDVFMKLRIRDDLDTLISAASLSNFAFSFADILKVTFSVFGSSIIVRYTPAIWSIELFFKDSRHSLHRIISKNLFWFGLKMRRHHTFVVLTDRIQDNISD